MVKLHVHTPFTLRHDDGTLEHFAVGERDMPSATATHWYVKHHTREPGDVPKPAAAPVDGAELAAARAALEAQAEHLAAARQEASDEAARLAALRTELDERTKALEARADQLDARDMALAVREQAVAEQAAAVEVAQKAASQDGAPSAETASGHNCLPAARRFSAAAGPAQSNR